jgi:hypothetical protein
MPWIKVDDQIAHHPKFMAAGAAASWLWVCGQSYCARYLTDGFVPESALPTLGNVTNPKAHAQTLVRVGLWEPTEGGYRVHDYLQFQPSRADVEERRRQRANAGRKGGLRSGHTRSRGARDRGDASPGASFDGSPDASSDASATSEAHAKQRASSLPRPRFAKASHADATRSEADGNPDPGPEPSFQPETAAAPGDPPPAFSRFWTAYPNKVGRREAWHAWRQLQPDDTLVETMLAAITRQRASRRWRAEAGRYIPNPATWLEQHRWDDELQPASEAGPSSPSSAVRGIAETLARLGESA